MWIPTPVYECLPYVCLAGGALFISGTMYIGLEASGALLYLACGVISTAYGLVILHKRRIRRRNSANVSEINSV